MLLLLRTCGQNQGLWHTAIRRSSGRAGIPGKHHIRERLAALKGNTAQVFPDLKNETERLEPGKKTSLATHSGADSQTQATPSDRPKSRRAFSHIESKQLKSLNLLKKQYKEEQAKEQIKLDKMKQFEADYQGDINKRFED